MANLPVPFDSQMHREPPNPLAYPHSYDGVAIKRMVAYAIDLVAIFVIGIIVWLATTFVTILTLGMLAPVQAVALTLVPPLYHILLIGGPASATLGQRLLGLRVISLVGTEKPGFLQATVQILLFYLSVGLTGFLILIWALFNPYRRCLHDYLSGCVILNRGTQDGG